MTISKKYKEHLPIIMILVAAFALRLAILLVYGAEYNLNSDDVSYVYSGIHFVETGTFYYRGCISAQMMPGMTWIIAIFCFLFGQGTTFWFFLKLCWICMGLLSIYGVYKIILLYANPVCAAIGASFFLAIDFAWLDNLILSETPYIMSFIYLIYASLQLGKTKQKKYFWYIIAAYIFCLFMRPTIAPYPLFLFAYLFFCHYDIKVMFKQMLIAGSILTIILVPWMYRNYQIFDKFIPLTYGMGNPKLLGTYQGNNAPTDEELDYQTNVYDIMDDEMRSYYHEEDGTWEVSPKGQYYNLLADQYKADYRMAQWWEKDKKDFLLSYLIKKPYIMVYNSFYWEDIFGIPIRVNLMLRILDIGLCIIGAIGVFLHQKRIKEFLFLSSIYVFMVYLGSYSFAFSRYGQAILFLRFILLGWGLYEYYAYCKERKHSKNKGELYENSSTDTVL